MEALMNQFWNSTNPSSLSESRYLWTDAFAVCNYIALYTKYSNKIFLHKALELVDSVHFVLGRYSLQESRKGWISGLTEDNGKLNPTQNGLRIGKKLLERSEHDAYDEDLEWDRDGQYFHYLTKWMYALCVVGNTTGDVKYKDWAVKLAQGVHDKFVHSVGKRKRLYWKMSVNLSRPLIQSMGHHDPLDGLITYQQIQSTLSDDAKTVLSRQIAEMLGICEGRDWTTTDPLGLGGLLCDAYRVHTLLGRDDVALDTKLLETLLQCACKGLEAYVSSRYEPQKPARFRLAFRELGLAIGLQAIQRMLQSEVSNGSNENVAKSLEEVHKYLYLINDLNTFWSDEKNQMYSSWTDHNNISTVMLATSLMPDGYLNI